MFPDLPAIVVADVSDHDRVLVVANTIPYLYELLSLIQDVTNVSYFLPLALGSIWVGHVSNVESITHYYLDHIILTDMPESLAADRLHESLPAWMQSPRLGTHGHVTIELHREHADEHWRDVTVRYEAALNALGLTLKSVNGVDPKKTDYNRADAISLCDRLKQVRNQLQGLPDRESRFLHQEIQYVEFHTKESSVKNGVSLSDVLIRPESAIRLFGKVEVKSVRDEAGGQDGC